jgi:LDH2 family malate/lactate/ureidoglycolate dehydrogenase
MTTAATTRFDAATLQDFAQQLLQRAGMPLDKARDVADILVEGDLLGHDTHGLQLLPTYLAEIESGSMTVAGEPLVLADLGAVLSWDGRRLPGPWLTLRAIEEASRRARRHGTGIVNMRRSHHIAALAPYARRVAEDGLVLLLMSSAPAASSVAPFGGTRALFSPSPIGVGLPTGGEPVMVDVSTSITTNGLTGRLAREGRKLPGAWLLDEHGATTDDPAVLVPPRAGTILPLGGTDAGHKGYGLSLMVEALTAGLAGQGRSDPGARWGATVFVQVIDPQAFNGRAAFEAQMDWIAGQCEANPPVRPGEPVRLPGRRGLALRAQALRSGVALSAGIVAALATWAEKLLLPMPAALPPDA